MDHVEVQVGDAASLAPAGGNAAPERRDLAPEPVAATPSPGRWARFLDGDFWHSFRSSPMAIGAAIVALLCLVAAVFANVIAPHNPFDLATLELSDSMLPPSWMQGGSAKYLLGTDEQGRDVLSALMFGARISLFVGGASVLLSLVIGVGLGPRLGLRRRPPRRADHAGLRRHAVVPVDPDRPAVRRRRPRALSERQRLCSPSAWSSSPSRCPGWVQYARAVRGSTMVERNKEYVQAARVIGVSPLRIMLRHVLPNVMGPVLVLSTIQVAVAILAEATLSFLGVGVSPTSPSLGTFINEGNKQLFSGAWWLVIFPGATLVLIALSINLFGDWLRDALNPRLR